MEKLGIKYIYSPDFMNFKNLTAEEFVTLVLCDKLSAEYVISGEDFRFGAGASSGVNELIRLCKKHGIEVIIVPPVMQDGLKISSTIIREYIRNGEIKAANRLLGYEFQLKLPVTYGNRIGRTINFPTINQYLPKRQVIPKYGVYASRAEYDGRIYSAITNIGVKPTVGSNNMPLAETHIIGFDNDLYGETVTIYLIDFIRPECKFGSIEELSKQIKLDIQAANKIL
jgi:riboflavin kinase/FMN adenylyltransferase